MTRWDAIRAWTFAAAATGLILGAGTAAAATGESQAAAAPVGSAEQAVWTPRELRFIYQGFTSRFSCDGLRSKIQTILTELGARREDLKVYSTPCAEGPGRPDPFPGVTAKFSVLEPVGAAAGQPAGSAAGTSAAKEPAAPAQPVSAHWKTVELLKNETALEQSGQCELLEQVKQRIVPLFAARNVELSSNCVPHQLSAGGARLKADVLIADPVPKGATAPR